MYRWHTGYLYGLLSLRAAFRLSPEECRSRPFGARDAGGYGRKALEEFTLVLVAVLGDRNFIDLAIPFANDAGSSFKARCLGSRGMVL